MRAEVLGCGVLCRGQPLQVGHCLGGVRSDTAEEIQLGVVGNGASQPVDGVVRVGNDNAPSVLSSSLAYAASTWPIIAGLNTCWQLRTV